MNRRRPPIQASTFFLILAVAAVVGTGLGILVQSLADERSDEAEPTTTVALDPGLSDSPEALWMFGSTTFRSDAALEAPAVVPVEVFGAVDGATGSVYAWSASTGEFRVLDTAENAVTTTVHVDLTGDVDPATSPVLASVPGGAWIVTGPDTLARVDATSGDVIADASVPASFTGLADGTEVLATRVVASGDTVTALFDVATPEGTVAVGLASIDAESGEIRTIAALSGRAATGAELAAAGADAVWLVVDGSLVRVAAADLAESGRIQLAGSELGAPFDALLAVGDDAWLVNRDGPELSRIGPSLGSGGSVRLAEAGDDVADAPVAAAAGDGRVYTLLQRTDGSSIVASVDVDTVSVERRIGLPAGNLVAALAFSTAPEREAMS